MYSDLVFIVVLAMLRWARKQGLVGYQPTWGGDMRKMIVQATAVETFR